VSSERAGLDDAGTFGGAVVWGAAGSNGSRVTVPSDCAGSESAERGDVGLDATVELRRAGDGAGMDGSNASVDNGAEVELRRTRTGRGLDSRVAESEVAEVCEVEAWGAKTWRALVWSWTVFKTPRFSARSARPWLGVDRLWLRMRVLLVVLIDARLVGISSCSSV